MKLFLDYKYVLDSENKISYFNIDSNLVNSIPDDAKNICIVPVSNIDNGKYKQIIINNDIQKPK